MSSSGQKRRRRRRRGTGPIDGRGGGREERLSSTKGTKQADGRMDVCFVNDSVKRQQKQVQRVSRSMVWCLVGIDGTKWQTKGVLGSIIWSKVLSMWLAFLLYSLPLLRLRFVYLIPYWSDVSGQFIIIHPPSGEQWERGIMLFYYSTDSLI